MALRAVIDIGTNSVLLLVGERRAEGGVAVLRDEARVTRLGQSVAKLGALQPQAVERTLKVLAEYRALAERDGAEELQAVATAGLRLAHAQGDQQGFLAKADQVLGRPVRLITGDEEAELSYRSVAAESPADALLRVIDIGGGSTELICGRGMAIEDQRSHPIGSVRLTEQFADGDPASFAMVAAMEDEALRAFASQPLPPHPELIGLAGTVTTAAALLLELEHYDREAIDGQRFSRVQVSELREYLAAQSSAERARHPCLPAGRADVIVAGLTILLAAMQHCGAKTLLVRDRGLRYALV